MNERKNNISEDFIRGVSDDSSYKGNGWSQYQIFVLKQLDDHGNFLEKIVSRNSITDTSLSLMQKEIEQNSKMIKKIEEILEISREENKKYRDKIGELEKEKEFELRLRAKSKVFWGTIGALFMAAISIIFQLFDKIFKFFSPQ